VGTSGWNYRPWRGDFYPEGLRQRDWLSHLSRGLDTVEINGSFYRVPSPESVASWVRAVPSDFRFAVKLWRGITHFKKLKDAEDHLRTFFHAFEPLPTRKRGPLLVQLPPSLGIDLDRLDRFLDTVRRVTAPSRWRVAIEPRHDSWLDDRVYRLLDRQRAALCLHDMPGRAASNEPGGASFVYLRRHGPGGRHDRGYSRQQIRADARRVRRWLDAGKTVYAYYNNDGQAHAPRDARRLREALG
jgi:uncharacterized protein YecE (DUF72 family)